MTSRTLESSDLSTENRQDALRTLDPQPTRTNPLPEDEHNDQDNEAQESTPLLNRRHDSDAEQNGPTTGRRRSWWTIISIAILLVITINIIVFAFVIPSAAQSYGNEATTYEIQDIEILNYTETGVVAETTVNVTIDASRVSSNSVRNLGLFGTNLFKHLYTQPCLVNILLPQYNGAKIGTAAIPALAIDIRDHHINLLNVISTINITNESLVVQL